MRIEKAKGRKTGSGYARLFGNVELGHLMSRVQSAVISSGNELEKLILDQLSESMIENLDEFLQREIMPDGVRVAPKRMVKKCETLDFAGAEPDFVIFKRRGGKQRCHIIELKDGDAFDTKKAAAEHTAMHQFVSKNAQHLPYMVHTHFCCFNQDDKAAIVEGFKRKISLQEAMTGREFCDLLELDYQAIVDMRAEDAPENIRYFLSELVAIRSIRKLLEKLLG